MAPLIMLEHESAGEARQRSRGLVKPHTWPVLGVIVVTFLLTTILAGIFDRVEDPLWLGWALSVAASAVTVPFSAHVLSVLYYRITDPENRVIHRDVSTWRSVWDGA